jgi:hypothetical protein
MQPIVLVTATNEYLLADDFERPFLCCCVFYHNNFNFHIITEPRTYKILEPLTESSTKVFFFFEGENFKRKECPRHVMNDVIDISLKTSQCFEQMRIDAQEEFLIMMETGVISLVNYITQVLQVKEEQRR